MYGRLHIALSMFLMGLACIPAAAQESLGVFNSVKGIGATVRLQEKDGIFHTATAFVDIYGVATSRCSNPGIRVNVSSQYVLDRQQYGDINMTFYTGPGVTLGFVRDHDKGRGVDLTSIVSDNEGFMAAVSGDIGCRFDFGGRVGLDLSFASDIGIHFRKNEKEREYFAPSVSIYNNGWMQWLYPQLTFLFKL